jgi:beta-glucosidase
MTNLVFPKGFLWGAASAAHQVEGGNENSDWWDWELRPGSNCPEPSGIACDNWHRYPADIALAASLGLNTYRYSLEWSRLEPEEGVFDGAALDHYLAVTDAVIAAGMTPMVTLYHFTLPRWLARKGGWLSPEAPALLARYAGRVVRALGDRVRWYCTINEPGVVAFGGYLGALGFPPGKTDMGSWERASANLTAAQRLVTPTVKDANPSAMVGFTNSMMEWEADGPARSFMEWMRRRNEDVFLAAAEQDDFVGIQTYTRVPLVLPAWQSLLLRVAVRMPPVIAIAAPPLIRKEAMNPEPPMPEDRRRTQMGYEFRPQAIAATIRRVASLLPGKPLVVTEHGVATDDDAERVEFIDGGLRAIHGELAAGVPVRGYIHWSLMDNFEWARGYAPHFGLIGVDRATLERTVRPSGRHLGAIAKAGSLAI